MPKILLRFEKSTLQAIDRIAPASKWGRTEFIRQAVKDAIFRREQASIRTAYGRQPDSADESDTWDLPEAWG